MRRKEDINKAASYKLYIKTLSFLLFFYCNVVESSYRKYKYQGEIRLIYIERAEYREIPTLKILNFVM